MAETRKADVREAENESRNRIQAETERGMSEARDSTLRGAQEAREGVERGADTMRSNVEKGAEAAEQSAREGARAAEHLAQRTGESMRQAMESGRKVARIGATAFAGVQGPLADTSYEEGRRWLDHAAKASDLYRSVAERTAEDVEALAVSYSKLGRGVQNWQQTYFGLLNQALQNLHRKPQDLLRARTLSEFAEVQRDLYEDSVKFMLTASTTLLELGARIAQEAVQPLKARGQSPERA